MLEVHGPEVLTELLDQRDHLVAIELQASHLQPEQAVPGSDTKPNGSPACPALLMLVSTRWLLWSQASQWVSISLGFVAPVGSLLLCQYTLDL